MYEWMYYVCSYLWMYIGIYACMYESWSFVIIHVLHALARPAFPSTHSSNRTVGGGANHHTKWGAQVGAVGLERTTSRMLIDKSLKYVVRWQLYGETAVTYTCMCVVIKHSFVIHGHSPPERARPRKRSNAPIAAALKVKGEKSEHAIHILLCWTWQQHLLISFCCTVHMWIRWRVMCCEVCHVWF